MIQRTTKLWKSILCAILISAPVASAGAELSISTWRNDDFYVWKQFVFPEFQKSVPRAELSYDSFEKNVRNEFFYRLENDPTTSIIACKPFKLMDDMAEAGHLVPLEGKIDLSAYSQTALSAWRASHDGQVYCMPFAAVAHAFLYNKQHFEEAGVTPPVTMGALFEALEKLDTLEGSTPYLMGLRSAWANVVLGHDLIGPTYWRGNDGIEALITSERTYRDPMFLRTFDTLKRLRSYMGKEAGNIEQITNLRQFNKGKVSIMPHGSWDISLLTPEARANTGVFAPVRAAADDPCYVTWHMDIGFGISAKYPDQDLALAFLQFLQTPKAMEIFTTHLPGFFLLHQDAPLPKEPLAREYRNIVNECEHTQRFSRMITKYVNPAFTKELVRVTTSVLMQEMSPLKAAGTMDNLISSTPPASK